MGCFSHLDIVRGVAIDPMHGVYGGITKALVCLWFDSTHHGQPWYCKNKMSSVEERLQKVTPTHETTKAVRSLNDRKFWKGL